MSLPDAGSLSAYREGSLWVFFFPFTFMLPAVQAQVLVMELLLRVIKDKFFRSPFD